MTPDPVRAREDEYAKLLSLLDDAIEECHRKVTSGRVLDAENERVRQGWIRSMAYCANVRRQITVDRDLSELGERVEQIERLIEEGERGAYA